MRKVLALVTGLLLAATAVPSRGEAAARKPKMVRMVVLKVGVIQGKYVVLLQTLKGATILPIWIGQREAQAIQLALANITPPRPLTHNLMAATLKRLRAKIDRVEVVRLQKGVFIGNLVVSDSKGKLHRIDARPSDLIALAVGGNKPIYAAADVIKKAGIKRSGAKGKGGTGI